MSEKARCITRPFRVCKRLVFRSRILAAFVGVRRGCAFALKAAIHRLGIRRVAREAIEGPEQQHNRQEAYHDVSSWLQLESFDLE